MIPPEKVETHERRSGRYSFPSLAALKTYFNRWLPQQDVDTKIEEATREFRIRGGVSEEETRLQLVKKCENALLRALMGPMFTGKPSDQDLISFP